MIQILGLRDFLNKAGKTQKTTRFFSWNLRLASMDDIFNPEKTAEIIAKIPEGERYNMYFTVADCFEDKERELEAQWYIPFDIDKITFPNESLTEIDTYAKAVLAQVVKSLGCPMESVGAIFSGHGVQVFVRLSYAIRSKEYFDTEREHYAAICERITKDLAKAGLTGAADPTVWSHARLMRMPGTINKKPEKTNRTAYVLTQGIPKPYGYYLTEHSGFAEFRKAETVTDDVLKQYPKPDTKAVLDGCLFLQHCQKSPQQISEPQWYAQMSITARLENGRDITHRLSEGHSGYNFDETDTKIDQALKAAGPRTCKDIDSRWGGCKNCPHFGKVTSPIMIRGEDYIASSEVGFRKMIIKEGQPPRKGSPAYDDLIKAFGMERPYVCLEGSNDLYVFNGKFWQNMCDSRARAWMTEKVKPAPSGAEMKEFCTRLYVTNLASPDWFSQAREFKMNFQNCVLDLKTMKASPHKPEFGFLNILSFDYDPLATAPRWKQFLMDSMNGDQELVQLLEEFAGYALSGDPYPSWAHKCLVLEGDGENGKSVFLDTLGEIAGDSACSSVPIKDFEAITSRHRLLGRLFNKSEETGKSVFRDTDVFKAITAGGIVTARELYKDEIEFRNTCKIIMSCNALPNNSDNSHGFTRRLIIVPFRVKFDEGNTKRDPHLYSTLLTQLPGICNSLIAAYRTAKGRGRFVQSSTAKKEVKKYEMESDMVRQLLEDRLLVLPPTEEVMAYKDDIYREYSQFCENGGAKPQTAVQFWRHMRKLVPDLDNRETRIGSRDARRLAVKGMRLLGMDI